MINWCDKPNQTFPGYAQLGNRCRVVLVVFVNILAEVLLLGLDAASIVVLMGTGAEIAKLATGRTSVIAVGKEVI